MVWLASSPEVETENGKFWIDRHPVRCRFRNAEQGGKAIPALRGDDRAPRRQCPLNFSPASIRSGSTFCFGGSGHVA